MKKYRIKRTLKWYKIINTDNEVCTTYSLREIPTYHVQLKTCFKWITIKKYFHMDDANIARRAAESLLDRLNQVI